MAMRCTYIIKIGLGAVYRRFACVAVALCGVLAIAVVFCTLCTPQSENIHWKFDENIHTTDRANETSPNGK